MKNILIFKNAYRSYTIFSSNNKFFYLTASKDKNVEDWIKSIKLLQKVENQKKVLESETFIIKEQIKFNMDFITEMIVFDKLNFIKLYQNIHDNNFILIETHLDNNKMKKLYDYLTQKYKNIKYITNKHFKNYLHRIYLIENESMNFDIIDEIYNKIKE